MVAVERLDHDGEADGLGGPPGLRGRLGEHAARHGNAGGGQQLPSQLFVARDRLGDRRRLVGLGRPDPALPPAVAELHEAQVAEPAPGNATGGCRVDDEHRARTEADVVGPVHELIADRSGRGPSAAPQRLEHRGRRLEAIDDEHRVAGLYHERGAGVVCRGAGKEKPAGRAAGDRLERQGHLAEQLDETGRAGRLGEQARAFRQAGIDGGEQAADRRLSVRSIEVHGRRTHLDRRPDIRREQMPRLRDLHP